MQINAIGVGQNASSTRGASHTDSSTTPGLKRDNFMELLLMQLRSQDPMNPMDSSEMFNQMAQLSMLEQLWDMRDLLASSNASQQLAQGSMLIGRYVEANTEENGQISGLVEQARMVSGDVWLQIGDEEVRLDQVVTVQ